MRRLQGFGLGIVLMAACSKPVVKPEAPPAQPPPVSAAPAAKPAPAPEAPAPVEESKAETKPVPAKPAEPAEPPAPVVRFDFNSWFLDQPSRDQLADYARWWVASGKKKLPLVIEGHADERGTAEFNLVLGDKRAASVRKYLGAMGVPVKKIKTISYGENRPADPGHDEAAYAANRRAEAKPVAAK
jgi:peptidoglycan-associated lipoprotein